MSDIETRIASLDLSLFEAVESQTTDGDRTSLLSIQNAVRSRVGEYTYLEIGSYHGGSIQPHLLDPLCRKIYSVDKRPQVTDDERGSFSYEQGHTHVMMDKLKAVSPENIGKIQTFDMDASELPPDAIEEHPDLFFIDGEHTDPAVVSDFNAIRPLIDGPCIVAFHDCQFVFRGISNILDSLKAEGSDFRAYVLPNAVFVIEMNGFDLHRDPGIQNQLADNYQAYIPALDTMYSYREYCCRHWIPRMYIRLYKGLYRFYSKTLRRTKKGG